MCTLRDHLYPVTTSLLRPLGWVPKLIDFDLHTETTHRGHFFRAHMWSPNTGFTVYNIPN